MLWSASGVRAHLGLPFMILQVLLTDLGSIEATCLVIATTCWKWSVMCGSNIGLFSAWQMQMGF